MVSIPQKYVCEKCMEKLNIINMSNLTNKIPKSHRQTDSEIYIETFETNIWNKEKLQIP